MQHLFGRVTNGEIQLSQVGRIVEEEWLRTPRLRVEVELDEFVIMPNHLHGILVFHDCLDSQAVYSGQTVRAHGRAPLHCFDRSLGSMMKGFKSACQKRINLLRQTTGKSVWQRNYHEHIIRNDEDLRNVREYILDNPLRWEVEHPSGRTAVRPPLQSTTARKHGRRKAQPSYG